MATYFIALVKVKDAAKLQEYASAAGPTLVAAGGTVVTRGKVAAILAGRHDAQNCLIAKFPDTQAAKNWYNSPAYQALLGVREQAVDPTFFLIEEPT
ncbi:MAG: DUF1330 domain-containing protein [Gammaproteobacteria bacterium]|nr:DUF1330 domain-containing protein [Gammaproteobacteria bacterium]